MKKHVLLFLSLVSSLSVSYAVTIYQWPKLKPIIRKQVGVVPSLAAMNTMSLFYFENEEQKNALNKKLKENRLFAESLRFDGLIVGNLNLSGMYLRDINFSNGIFFNVNFTNADLRGARFIGTFFRNVELRNAVIYYPFDVPDEEVRMKGFKIDDFTNFSDQSTDLEQYFKIGNDYFKKQFYSSSPFHL